MKIDGTEYDIEAEDLKRLAESDLPVAPYAEVLLDMADDVDKDDFEEPHQVGGDGITEDDRAELGVEMRSATVNRDADDEPLGIPVYLSADQLRELGVDVQDAESVDYGIADGSLVFQPER